jgi:flagellar protein FlgJ
MESLSSSSKLKDYQVVSDVQALNGLKQTAKKDQASALRPVAEQFEALFLNEIMKQSRKVKMDDGWLDGGQSDFFKQWHDQQLSQNLSTKGSLGLADLIVKQLSPQAANSESQKQSGEYFGKMIPNEQEVGQSAKLSAPNVSSASPSTQQIVALRSME